MGKASFLVFLSLLPGLCAISPAGALVAGKADPALAGSTIMVLKSNGGVCSGVVVAANVVLTAAHCATGTEQYRIHYRNTDGTAVMLEPESKNVHPGYVAGAVKARKPSADLALFKLKEPLPSSFSAAALSSRHPQAGSRVVIGGYGLSRVDDPRSMGTFRSAGFLVKEPYGAGRLLIWVQGTREGGADAMVCTGDSGGPMAIDGAVFAITAWAEVSRKTPCGPGSQGVLLGPQRAWIDGVLAKWGQHVRWQD